MRLEMLTGAVRVEEVRESLLARSAAGLPTDGEMTLKTVG
jgi:hypothetical protein